MLYFTCSMIPIVDLACYVVSRVKDLVLSYYVAVIQWITSSHKNRMTTHEITL